MGFDVNEAGKVGHSFRVWLGDALRGMAKVRPEAFQAKAWQDLGAGLASHGQGPPPSRWPNQKGTSTTALTLKYFTVGTRSCIFFLQHEHGNGVPKLQSCRIFFQNDWPGLPADVCLDQGLAKLTARHRQAWDV